VHAQNRDKMQEEEKFVGSLANGTQADKEEETKSTNGKDSILDELRLETSWFQTKTMHVRRWANPLTE